MLVAFARLEQGGHRVARQRRQVQRAECEAATVRVGAHRLCDVERLQRRARRRKRRRLGAQGLVHARQFQGGQRLRRGLDDRQRGGVAGILREAVVLRRQARAVDGVGAGYRCRRHVGAEEQGAGGGRGHGLGGREAAHLARQDGGQRALRRGHRIGHVAQLRARDAGRGGHSRRAEKVVGCQAAAVAQCGRGRHRLVDGHVLGVEEAAAVAHGQGLGTHQVGQHAAGRHGAAVAVVDLVGSRGTGQGHGARRDGSGRRHRAGGRQLVIGCLAGAVGQRGAAGHGLGVAHVLGVEEGSTVDDGQSLARHQIGQRSTAQRGVAGAVIDLVGRDGSVDGERARRDRRRAGHRTGREHVIGGQAAAIGQQRGGGHRLASAHAGAAEQAGVVVDDQGLARHQVGQRTARERGGAAAVVDLVGRHGTAERDRALRDRSCCRHRGIGQLVVGGQADAVQQTGAGRHRLAGADVGGVEGAAAVGNAQRLAGHQVGQRAACQRGRDAAVVDLASRHGPAQAQRALRDRGRCHHAGAGQLVVGCQARAVGQCGGACHGLADAGIGRVEEAAAVHDAQGLAGHQVGQRSTRQQRADFAVVDLVGRRGTGQRERARRDRGRGSHRRVAQYVVRGQAAAVGQRGRRRHRLAGAHVGGAEQAATVDDAQRLGAHQVAQRAARQGRVQAAVVGLVGAHGAAQHHRPRRDGAVHVEHRAVAEHRLAQAVDDGRQGEAGHAHHHVGRDVGVGVGERHRTDAARHGLTAAQAGQAEAAAAGAADRRAVVIARDRRRAGQREHRRQAVGKAAARARGGCRVGQAVLAEVVAETGGVEEVVGRVEQPAAVGRDQVGDDGGHRQGGDVGNTIKARQHDGGTGRRGGHRRGLDRRVAVGEHRDHAAGGQRERRAQVADLDFGRADGDRRGAAQVDRAAQHKQVGGGQRDRARAAGQHAPDEVDVIAGSDLHRLPRRRRDRPAEFDPRVALHQHRTRTGKVEGTQVQPHGGIEIGRVAGAGDGDRGAAAHLDRRRRGFRRHTDAAGRGGTAGRVVGAARERERGRGVDSGRLHDQGTEVVDTDRLDVAELELARIGHAVDGQGVRGCYRAAWVDPHAGTHHRAV